MLPTSVDDSSPAWRGYRLMTLRYVEALDVTAVRSALAIGHSEYYREHRKALDAVVSLFRERYVAIPGHAAQKIDALLHF